MSEEMKAYHREWWENPERRDPRAMVFKRLNSYLRGRIPGGVYFIGEGTLPLKALDLGCGRGTITRMLMSLWYNVTAVDVDPVLLSQVHAPARNMPPYPWLRKAQADIRKFELVEDYDIVTCIETAQNLTGDELKSLLYRLWGHTRLLLINISNSRSTYSAWLRLMGWQKSFVHTHDPSWFLDVLRKAGWKVTHTRGFGLLMPLSLRREYRWTFLPAQFAEAVNRYGDCLTGACHLFYVEARGGAY